MPNYIRTIRDLVGHTPIILNAAGGIVLNDDNEVLLQQRPEGTWSIPGGYLEYGESYAEAVVREVKEDAGLDVEVIRALGLFDNHYETILDNGDVLTNIGMLFLVKPIGGSFAAASQEETLQLQYFPLDALPPIAFKQNADMLDLVRNRLDEGELFYS